MAIVTATQVTTYTDISATAGTITTSGLIPIVQDRINDYCYNWFLSDGINLQCAMTFTAATGDIVASGGNSFVTAGFADDDEFYVYGSYRNDGYYTISSVETSTISIASSESVVAELSGASILVSLVRWPDALKYSAAQMVKFDYDDRPTRVGGLASQSLGPRSESYAVDTGGYGYPKEILGMLNQYRIARVM